MTNNSNNNKAPFPPKQTFLTSEIMEEISKQESSKAKSEPLLSKLDKQYDVSYNHYEESVKLNKKVEILDKRLADIEARTIKLERWRWTKFFGTLILSALAGAFADKAVAWLFAPKP